MKPWLQTPSYGKKARKKDRKASKIKDCII
jgi:hypothetical protein